MRVLTPTSFALGACSEVGASASVRLPTRLALHQGPIRGFAWTHGLWRTAINKTPMLLLSARKSMSRPLLGKPTNLFVRLAFLTHQLHSLAAFGLSLLPDSPKMRMDHLDSFCGKVRA